MNETMENVLETVATVEAATEVPAPVPEPEVIWKAAEEMVPKTVDDSGMWKNIGMASTAVLIGIGVYHLAKFIKKKIADRKNKYTEVPPRKEEAAEQVTEAEQKTDETTETSGEEAPNEK